MSSSVHGEAFLALADSALSCAGVFVTVCSNLRYRCPIDDVPWAGSFVDSIRQSNHVRQGSHSVPAAARSRPRPARRTASAISTSWQNHESPPTKPDLAVDRKNRTLRLPVQKARLDELGHALFPSDTLCVHHWHIPSDGQWLGSWIALALGLPS